jgi:uncharacterized membrane protein
MDNIKKTSLGLDENIEAALCYFPFPLITGILFFVLEKDSKFVKFHAMQSIAMCIALIVIDMILVITIVGMLLLPLVGLVAFILIIFLVYKAYKGEKYKLPVIGDFAEKQAA